MNALTPLPTLAEALPPTSSAAPDGSFTRPRQVEFLHALAACGAVRRAAGHIGISYRTAYRERRANPAFRRAWDAALLSARALSEDVLATRALDGVEEDVMYHGEVVATRRRYDARLLLAHLARLDRLTEDARTRAFAEDYEGALERFAAGIDDPAPVCEQCGEALPVPVPAQAQAGGGGEAGDAGPDAANGPAEAAPCLSPSGLCDKCDSARARESGEGGQAAPSETAPDSAADIGPFEPCPHCGGPCDDPDAVLGPRDCMWLGNRLERMYAARPRHARKPHEIMPDIRDSGDIEWAQLLAFEDGVEEWWLVMPDWFEEGMGE